jgi:hypothetical protein
MCTDGECDNQLAALAPLLEAEGVGGAARLGIAPAFSGPVVCTLVYAAEAVTITVEDARGLGGGTFRGQQTKPLRKLRRFRPLSAWGRLRMAAEAAPSCATLTCDGASYRHLLLDRRGGLDARWSNPDPGEHPRQCELVRAYRALAEASALLLEEGRRVVVRTGLLAGFTGVVERLDRYAGRVRVVAGLGGAGVAVELSVADIQCAPAEQADRGVAADRGPHDASL